MRISVIVPTFNRIGLLKQTIDSVRAQTYSHWEAVVVDDASTDGTKEWLLSCGTEDPRVRLIERAAHRPNKHGAQVCRNLGLSMALGESILFLDSDDLLDPRCLEYRIKELNSDPSLDAVVGQALRFRDKPGDLGSDSIWSQWSPGEDDLDSFLTQDIQWQTSGPLWRRTALDRVGPWEERLQHVGHDHEFHVRALCRGVRVHKLSWVDYFWRIPRTDSLSSFESFKKRHRDGSMITAYRAILAEVVHSGSATPHRRRLMAGEGIRLAVCCRNFGGTPSVAEQAVLDARRQRLLGACNTWFCRLLLRCWLPIGCRLPAMMLLNRLATQVSRAE